MSSEHSSKYIYSEDQIAAYFSHVSFPTTKYGDTKDLSYLTTLQRHQLAHVPFENLSLHYSSHRTLSLDKDDLFVKFVPTNRGGYCMENNLFFATVLRTLGFEVIATGARVGSSGWSHQVNLVRLSNEVFMVDVGFGSQGPTRPLPLVHGAVSKWGNTQAETRLMWKEPAASFLQGTWTYEHRNSPSDPWSPIYNFTMTEFKPADFEVMNYATSTRNTSFFTYKVICVKFLLDEEKENLVGALTLDGKTLKKRIQDQKEVLGEFVSEGERIAGLKEHFGITFTEKEQASIKGTITEVTV